MSQVCNKSDPEVTNQTEEVVDENMNPPSPSSSIYTLFEDEYVLDDDDGKQADDDGEQELEREDKTKTQDVTIVPAPEAKKPGHQRASPGIYEELDYSLNPQIGAMSHGQTDLKEKNGCFKERKSVVLSVLGTVLAAAVASGVVLSLKG